MWIRRYFCGIEGEMDEETIKACIESQREQKANKNFKIVEEVEWLL